MSCLEYSIIGATTVVGAAFLFGDSAEEGSYSFDKLEDELENEAQAASVIIPEA